MPKVAIVGCGFVGSTTAFSILLEGVASELILIEKTKKSAEGQALDLEHGMEFLRSAKIISGSDYKLLKSADIIVVTAGAHQELNETRLDLVSKNSKIYKEIIPKIAKHNKKAIMIIVTNPVDVMTYLAIKYSKYPKQKVIGTGTSLDTARLNYYLSEKLKVNPLDIHAYILGEHGDSSFPAWSTATIDGIKIKHYIKATKKILNYCYKKTKNAAYEIISKKGATYYAIALTITEIIKAIAEDNNKVMPVSTLLENYYGISDVCLSKIFKTELDKSEINSLNKSAKIIKETMKSMGL